MKAFTQENYKKLYDIVHALEIAFGVMCIVLAAVAVLALFVDISILGEIDTSLEFGPLKLTPAKEQLPSGADEKIVFVVSLVVTVVDFAFGYLLAKIFCGIIKPLMEGEEYGNRLSVGLLTLSKLFLIGGIVTEIVNLAGTSVIYNFYNVESLLVGEKIASCVMNYNFDGSNIVIAAVLFLLSHLFAYGEELQRQVDETL